MQFQRRQRRPPSSSASMILSMILPAFKGLWAIMLLCTQQAFVSGLSLSSAEASSSPALSKFSIIQSSKLWNTGRKGYLCPISSSSSTSASKSLVVLLPQLGEFDSAEFCEQLVAVLPDLQDAGVELSLVGIGSEKAGEKFCQFTNLNPDCLFVDSDAKLHQQLGLYNGPGWKVPNFVSDGVIRRLLNTLPGGAPPSSDGEGSLRPIADAWLNYLLMCAGIGAPGTLREIIRGYLGDTAAPERFRQEDIVKVKDLIEIGPGVGPVRVGPVQYTQWFADERGYQRPVELATVRLKNMVEVLENWDAYVSDPKLVSQRGGTFLFDKESGNILYEYRHRGVLTYSETMSRPLTFLTPYIGEDKARNPLGLPDNNAKGIPSASQSANIRGILKPTGKAMNILSAIFKLENQLQAKVVGVTQSDVVNATNAIQSKINQHPVVIYSYGLSPFSSKAVALLRDVCNDNDNDILAVEEIGLEWFLLTDIESCSKRLALLEMTGQSSLPQIFIGGKYVGGLFTGGTDSDSGIAGLQEQGKLKTAIEDAVTARMVKQGEANQSKVPA